MTTLPPGFALTTRADAPYGHTPLPPIQLGMAALIGIRDPEGEVDWLWSTVRRVIGSRIWVEFAGERVEITPEQIHTVSSVAAVKRYTKEELLIHRIPVELLGEIDRHLKLATLPSADELKVWVSQLEVLANFHEFLAADIKAGVESLAESKGGRA